jgi:predicted nucleic acid-binding protein
LKISNTSRKIILDSQFVFYAPDYIETEIYKHREHLIKKAKMTRILEIPGALLQV